MFELDERAIREYFEVRFARLAFSLVGSYECLPAEELMWPLGRL